MSAPVSDFRNAVLMDTRRHRTMVPRYGAPRIQVLVEVAYGDVQTAVFTFQGDFLRGDPVYLQTSGPEVPERWWTR